MKKTITYCDVDGCENEVWNPLVRELTVLVTDGPSANSDYPHLKTKQLDICNDCLQKLQDRSVYLNCHDSTKPTYHIPDIEDDPDGTTWYDKAYQLAHDNNIHQVLIWLEGNEELLNPNYNDKDA